MARRALLTVVMFATAAGCAVGVFALVAAALRPERASTLRRNTSWRAQAALIAAVAIATTACESTQKTSRETIPVTTIEAPSTTTTYAMPSSSMEPTLHCARPASGCESATSDRVVVHGPATEVGRADIVLFRAPARARLECGAAGLFVKRVIGIPGDIWEERGGVVYVNGRELDEPYLRPERRDDRTLTLRDLPPRGKYARIPRNFYLIVGDNRRSSCDSRVFGLVPQANILGKVVQIIRIK